MHPIEDVKKLYWQTWTTRRRALRKHGLTPARLDVLECLAKAGGRMRQSALARSLVVGRSTLCEGLVTMEQLGLVKRTPRVGRERDVLLTPDGRRKARAA